MACVDIIDKISKLQRIKGIKQIPKPEDKEFYFMTKEGISEIESQLNKSLSLHKEALEHVVNITLKRGDGEIRIKNENAKIDAETASFNVNESQKLDLEIVRLDNILKKELEEAKRNYELTCAKLEEKRNANIRKAQANSAKVKDEHLLENTAKKELFKETVLEEIAKEERVFDSTVSKLNAVNADVINVIENYNKRYVENRELYEKFNSF